MDNRKKDLRVVDQRCTSFPIIPLSLIRKHRFTVEMKFMVHVFELDDVFRGKVDIRRALFLETGITCCKNMAIFEPAMNS
jgi:hypothetical protein